MATALGSSVIGTWPQPRSRMNVAFGRCRLATRAWLGGSRRSFSPQAMVTGTSAGMAAASVKEILSARIWSTAPFARKKASASPMACSALIRDGFAMIAALMAPRPKVECASCGR